MRTRTVLFALACILAAPAVDGEPGASMDTRDVAATSHLTVTFEDRVAAQRAIERVYWNHRIWPKENPTPKPPLSAVMPDEAIRAKVEDYLEKSNALGVIWNRPVNADQLQAEMDRMAANTRDGQALSELFAALGDDPLLIAETLARQTLVERQVRESYANDARFHGELKRKAEAALASCNNAGCMKTMGGEYHETVWALRGDAATIADEKPGDHTMRLDAEEWKEYLDRLGRKFGGSATSLPKMQLSSLEETADAFVVTALLAQRDREITTATTTWRKESFDTWWAAQGATLDVGVSATGGSFALAAVSVTACLDDTWARTSMGTDVPAARQLHSAVWTGTEMIAWGGWGSGGWLDTGGRYYPSTDTWVATSTGTNVPAARQLHSAVWTGTEMIVWGGDASGGAPLKTGGRYNPATNTWMPTATATGVPAAREHHTAVWTGTKMIVWGGWGSGGWFDTGGLYDPATDTWVATSTGTNVPAARELHSAVWTGTEMIVWGGDTFGGRLLNTGGRYDPSKSTWLATSTGTNVPAAREQHSAVWTGTEMVVWGGWGSGGWLNTGGRYKPSTNTWVATSTGTNVPAQRHSHTAVWTGKYMIVWGGDVSGGGPTDTGGRYGPSTDSWTATATTTGVPSTREQHVAVWTGTEMIVWGGTNGTAAINSGGRYCVWTVYRDADGDGYGDLAVSITIPDGSIPAGYVTDATDCDDANPSIHPGVPETCNAIDDDCSGQADDDSLGVDTDADGVRNVCDNCPLVANTDQINTDMLLAGGDAQGDACDSDDDADGRPDVSDNCRVVPNDIQADSDADRVGDACDNCPAGYNSTQSDFDHDGEGDICDLNDGLIYVFGPEDKNHVAWQHETGPTTWNVYEGDLSVLRETGSYTQAPGSNGLADRHCAVPGTFVDDLVVPPSGSVKFSLVTGVTGGVEGSLGTNGAGEARANTNPCP